MDRLLRQNACRGLVLLMLAGGCRSPHAEVPSGPPINRDPAQGPGIGFNAEPGNATAMVPGLNLNTATTNGGGMPPTTANFGGSVARASSSAPNLNLAPADAINSQMQMPPRPSTGP